MCAQGPHTRTRVHTAEQAVYTSSTLTTGPLEGPRGKRMARAKKKIVCQDCDRTFNRKGELQQHRREEHSRRNMCPICKRAFESEKRLKMHSQFHNVDGEFKCFYCPKRFNKAWKMKIHLVNHSGRPSYLCEYCGEDFLYPGKIVAHLKRIHDVCYACKDCGRAIPIEYCHRPHKCKIYGCKDCLASFASQPELADHVNNTHGDAQCSPPLPLPTVESAPPSPLQGIGSQGVQESCDPLQGASPGSGGVEREERVPLEPDVVVLEETFGTKILGGWRPVEAGERVCGPAGQVSQVSCFGVQGNEGSKRGSPGLGAPEGPCDTGPQYLEVDKRLSRDLLVSPSPPGTPVRCSVPSNSERKKHNTSDLTLLVQGHRAPASTSVIESEEEDEEEDNDREEEEEEETLPPSYISSVLLRSPSSALRSRFKVPDASTGLWKKVETPATKSLRRKQDELDKAVKKRELLHTLQRYRDTDATLTQCSHTTFESWLATDSFSAPEHDYVFGFEASVSVGSHREDAHYHFFNKMTPMKEKVDMTFEDLCLF